MTDPNEERITEMAVLELNRLESRIKDLAAEGKEVVRKHRAQLDELKRHRAGDIGEDLVLVSGVHHLECPVHCMDLRIGNSQVFWNFPVPYEFNGEYQFVLTARRIGDDNGNP